MKTQYNNIPLSASLEMRELHQKKGLKGKELVKRYKQYSKTQIYRHMKMDISDTTGDKRKGNGRMKSDQCVRVGKNKCKNKYKKIPLTLSVFLRFLHQENGISGKELVKRYPKYSSSNIYKHMVKAVEVDLVDK